LETPLLALPVVISKAHKPRFLWQQLTLVKTERSQKARTALQLPIKIIKYILRLAFPMSNTIFSIDTHVHPALRRAQKPVFVSKKQIALKVLNL
jgi:hypothetical protein